MAPHQGRPLSTLRSARVQHLRFPCRFSAKSFESAIPVTWAMQLSDAETGGKMGKWQLQWQTSAISSLSWLSCSSPSFLSSPCLFAQHCLNRFSPPAAATHQVLCEAGADSAACSCLAQWGRSTFELHGGGVVHHLKFYIFYWIRTDQNEVHMPRRPT